MAGGSPDDLSVQLSVDIAEGKRLLEAMELQADRIRAKLQGMGAAGAVAPVPLAVMPAGVKGGGQALPAAALSTAAFRTFNLGMVASLAGQPNTFNPAPVPDAPANPAKARPSDAARELDQRLRKAVAESQDAFLGRPGRFGTMTNAGLQFGAFKLGAQGLKLTPQTILGAAARAGAVAAALRGLTALSDAAADIGLEASREAQRTGAQFTRRFLGMAAERAGNIFSEVWTGAARSLVAEPIVAGAKGLVSVHSAIANLKIDDPGAAERFIANIDEITGAAQTRRDRVDAIYSDARFAVREIKFLRDRAREAAEASLKEESERAALNLVSQGYPGTRQDLSRRWMNMFGDDELKKVVKGFDDEVGRVVRETGKAVLDIHGER